MIIHGPVKYLNQIQDSEKLRLFLDYDGTLADFAPTPDEIYPDHQLIDLLKQLMSNTRIDVAIISGRRLSHIKKLVPLKGILLAGTYGIEILFPDGGQIDRVDFQEIRPILEGIKPEWQKLIKPHANLYLEDKGWSLALHAKDVEEATADFVLGQARNLLIDIQGMNTDFRILGGHKFLEIAPLLANKGLAIEFFLNRQTYEALPVYIGDDDKDEEAFDKILKYQGVAIKVFAQSCETKAQLRIKDTRDVRQFLKSLL
ncbi:MAG: trehalose-phosphatase [Anaerolineaceae bacterium]|nr:trehalose-phosphatase [Anaerolineaceae bacterium]